MDWLFHFFQYPPDNLLIFGEFSPGLVALSVLIAIFTSAMALHMSSQARKADDKKQAAITLFTGSLAQGGGVWAMHFIGMLAFDLCTPVEYDLSLTLVSMLPSVAASIVALQLNSRPSINLAQLATGGVLMGAGIGSMHYIGMSGMVMAPALKYDPWIFTLSVVVAVLLAFFALWTRSAIRNLQQIKLSQAGADIAGGVVMGLAISAMHYTGMSAARFVPPVGFDPIADADHQANLLAIGVSLITVMITCLVVVVDLLLSYRHLHQSVTSKEHRLRAILQTAVDAIVTVNAKGVIVDVNPATEKIVGWQAEQLVGQSITTLMPESEFDSSKYDIEDYLATGAQNIIGTGRKTRVLHKSGDSIPVRLAVGHVKLPHENLYVGFLTDIREQLAMESELKENEERFRSLIGNIPGAAYRCLNTPNWDMLFISDAIESITGFPAGDFTLPHPKRSFTQLIHPEDLVQIQVLEKNHKPFNLEYRIYHRDGDIRWVQDNGGTILNKAGEIVWLDGFIMDITARKQLDLELINAKVKSEQAAMARTAFLTNMSHEIRTPMNAIIGFSDILMTTKLDPEQNKYLSTLRGSARSLLHLLDDILDSAKLEKGKMTLEIRDFSLAQLVDSVVSTLWIQAKNKELALDMKLSEELQEFYLGAPDRIRQVLVNLIGNAVKFTERGGVCVEVTPLPNHFVQFRITDTGIGIAADRIEAIFDPFTQADSSMDRRFGGTGLGTTISKQLVELMGGEISVQSTPGEGSCFQFMIPLQTGKNPLPENVAFASQQEPLEILVVDDVPQNQILLKLILEAEKHQVTCASDGLQALHLVREKVFDLILMDVQMPNMDGLSASAHIRELPECKLIPIIAMTASVLQEDKQAARQAGMDGFCSKPIDRIGLHQEIARVMELHSAAHQAENAHMPANDAYYDIAKGIALWGDLSTYVKELFVFVHQCDTTIHDLQLLWERKHFSALAQHAHRLTGLSGNLALIAFEPVLIQLEQSCKQNNVEACGESISLLKERVTRLKPMLESLCNELSQTAQSDLPQLDKAGFLRAIDTLLLAARQNQCDDSALATIINGQSWIAEDKLIRLDAAFNDFDFPIAIDLLTRFQAQISEV